MKTRMYFLVNQYIMGIQAGIQAGHAACEMLADYDDEPLSNPKVKLIKQWLKKDKTFILLDGGYQQRMYEFADLIPNSIPFAYFHEEEDALNGALTAISFVLPDYMYTAKLDEDGKAPAGYLEEGDDYKWVDFTYAERLFIQELKKFHLKRG